jgi:glycosidase
LKIQLKRVTTPGDYCRLENRKKIMTPEVIFMVLVDALMSEGVANPLAWQGGTYQDIIGLLWLNFFPRGSAILLPPATPQVQSPLGLRDPWSGWPAEGRNGYWADRLVIQPDREGGMDMLFELIRQAKSRGIEIWVDVAPLVGSKEATEYRRNPQFFAGENMGLPLLNFKNEGARQLFLGLVRDYQDLEISGFRWDSASHMDPAFLQGLPSNSFAELFDGDPVKVKSFTEETRKAVLDYPGYFVFSRALASASGNLNEVADMLTAINEYRRKAVSFISNNDQKSHRTKVIWECSGTPGEADKRTAMFLQFQFLAWPAMVPLVWYLDIFLVSGHGMEVPQGTNRAAVGALWSQGAVLMPLIRSLVAARKAHPALRYGQWIELWRPNDGPALLVGVRVHDGEKPVVVIVNNSNDSMTIPGVEVHGNLDSERPLMEVTGAPVSNLHVHDGRLTGSIPAMTVWAVVSL